MIDQPINMRQSLDVDLNKFLLHSKNLLLDLSKSDIRINNSCRLSVFINKMENFMKAISKSDILIKGEEIALLAEGIRDFFEMNVIVKSERVRYDGKKICKNYLAVPVSHQGIHCNRHEASNFSFIWLLSWIYQASISN